MKNIFKPFKGISEYIGSLIMKSMRYLSRQNDLRVPTMHRMYSGSEMTGYP